MQPQTPQRPVMDVTPRGRTDAAAAAPVRNPAPAPLSSTPGTPSSSALPVREAPVEQSEKPTVNEASTPAAQTTLTQTKELPKTPQPAPKKPAAQVTKTPLPVATIILTLLTMLGLSALAVAVYLQS